MSYSQHYITFATLSACGALHVVTAVSVSQLPRNVLNVINQPSCTLPHTLLNVINHALAVNAPCLDNCGLPGKFWQLTNGVESQRLRRHSC